MRAGARVADAGCATTTNHVAIRHYEIGLENKVEAQREKANYEATEMKASLEKFNL